MLHFTQVIYSFLPNNSCMLPFHAFISCISINDTLPTLSILMLSVHLSFKTKSNSTSYMKQSQTTITLNNIPLPPLNPLQTQLVILRGNAE